MNKYLKILVIFSCIFKNIYFFSQKSETTKDAILNKLQEQFLKQNVEYLNNGISLGIGVVNPKDFSFNLILDTVNYSKIALNSIESQQYIVPLIYKPDYQIFYLVVKKDLGKLFEVYINKNNTGYVQKNEFIFYTWPELLKSTICIRAKKGYINKNNLDGEVIFDDNVILIVENVQGDWVYANEQLNEEGILNKQGYWIQWRENDRLLIKPIFLQ